jgi:pimeloyl-ACP methyl ester carboxylesterase
MNLFDSIPWSRPHRPARRSPRGFSPIGRTLVSALLVCGLTAPLAAQTRSEHYSKSMDLLAVTCAKLVSNTKTGDELTIQGNFTKMFDTPVRWIRGIDQNENQLRAVIFCLDRHVVVAFRPTKTKANEDMNDDGRSDPGISGFNGHSIHHGWGSALNVAVNADKNFYEDIAQWTRVALGNGQPPAAREHVLAKSLIITGHSMGGAMAQYFAYRFADANKPWVPAAVIIAPGSYFVRTRVLTFGTPRAGYWKGAGINVAWADLRKDRNIWAGAVESSGDDTPNDTRRSGANPDSLGDVISINSSMPTDSHNIHNYMLFIARNWSTATTGNNTAGLPYSDMNNPLGSWTSPIKLIEPY